MVVVVVVVVVVAVLAWEDLWGKFNESFPAYALFIQSEDQLTRDNSTL